MVYVTGTSPRFEASLPFTLQQEGGKSNDRHDPGGATDDGIIQREYDLYLRANGLPYQSVFNITPDQYRDIYYHSYYLPHCPFLPPGLDLMFFDACVNSGPREAILFLQRSVSVDADGIWGEKTQAALPEDVPDTRIVIRNYAVHRASFYRQLPTFKYFGKDWLQRTADCKVASLKMADTLDAALDDITNNPPKPIMKEEPKS